MKYNNKMMTSDPNHLQNGINQLHREFMELLPKVLPTLEPKQRLATLKWLVDRMCQEDKGDNETQIAEE